MRRVWQGDEHEQYQMGWLQVQRYKRRWMTPPDFTFAEMRIKRADYADNRVN